jgi:hypothetical protein
MQPVLSVNRVTGGSHDQAYVSEENPVRVIDVFIEELDLAAALGFEGVVPEATGRPAYHPGLLLKIYVYGYINQIASSRRLGESGPRFGQAGGSEHWDQGGRSGHPQSARQPCRRQQGRGCRSDRRPGTIETAIVCLRDFRQLVDDS